MGRAQTYTMEVVSYCVRTGKREVGFLAGSRWSILLVSLQFRELLNEGIASGSDREVVRQSEIRECVIYSIELLRVGRTAIRMLIQ